MQARNRRELVEAYRSAKAAVGMVEERIAALKCEMERARDAVAGSNVEHPWTRRVFAVEGAVNDAQKRMISQLRAELLCKKRALFDALFCVEAMLARVCGVDKATLRGEMAVRLHYLDGVSWRECDRRILRREGARDVGQVTGEISRSAARRYLDG